MTLWKFFPHPPYSPACISTIIFADLCNIFLEGKQFNCEEFKTDIISFFASIPKRFDTQTSIFFLCMVMFTLYKAQELPIQ